MARTEQTWTNGACTLYTGDCLDVMRGLPDASVDLVFGSPPYVDCRTYGIDFNLTGQDWVDWMVERTREALRVSRGLVAWVVEGKTKGFRWDATPALLMADLHRAGCHLRKPPIFHRVGVPGSGGPDWLRNDFEFIVCCTKGGKLPWSDNTAMGHPPKWAPGGAMSNRLSDGARVNQWGHSADSGATVVEEGGVVRSKGKRPSHVIVNGRDQWGGTGHASSGEGREANGAHKGKRSFAEKVAAGAKVHTKHDDEAETRAQAYLPPVLANPGNLIQQTYTADEVAEMLADASEVTHHVVGGGCMGSKRAHENEAPFPESLAEFFIRSFCPEGGTVLEPFLGSGTTPAVALKWGRRAIGIDVRESQVKLAKRRIQEEAVSLFTEPAAPQSLPGREEPSVQSQTNKPEVPSE